MVKRKSRWQCNKVIVDIFGNVMSSLHKVTTKNFVAIDGTHYGREMYNIVDLCKVVGKKVEVI